MEITITINGKPVKAVIDDKDLEQVMKKEPKKSGYERANKLEDYFYCAYNKHIETTTDHNDTDDIICYRFANYYTDRNVATNNAKADTLLQQLRRFAAMNGGCVTGRYNQTIEGYEIVYDRYHDSLATSKVDNNYVSTFGSILFASEIMAQKAIDNYRNELMWYFKEYEPMPHDWWIKDKELKSNPIRNFPLT